MVLIDIHKTSFNKLNLNHFNFKHAINYFFSVCRNQAEMAHTCRGSIKLHGAFIHTEDSCTFVISNGGTQTFHIKAASEVERQRWVTALELAKTKMSPGMESGM